MRVSLDHVHLFSSNLSVTVDFFCTMFGATVIWDEDAAGVRNVRLAIGNAFIQVYDQPPKAPRGGAVHHLGIETDDLSALVSRMEAHTSPCRNALRRRRPLLLRRCRRIAPRSNAPGAARRETHVDNAATGGFMRTAFQRTFVTRVVLMLAMSAIVGHAHAADTRNGYRTTTMVASDQNECAGVPSCLSTTSPGVNVPGAGRVSQRFSCPTSHPNLWAWDASQHEQILVQLVAVDRFTATIEGVNATKVAGAFVVSLGCSTEPYAGGGFQKSRQLAPTESLPARNSLTRVRRPAASQVGTDNPCDGVPDCQLQAQASFDLGGWASTTRSYECKGEYPYAWSFTWSQTGSPSVSAIGAQFEEYPMTYDVLLTNWNLFATDQVDVTIACSKTNYWGGGTCGGTVPNPGCPVVAGSVKNYCSKGPVPICFQTYQERCAPAQQLFSCTTEFLLSWCQPCPG